MLRKFVLVVSFLLVYTAVYSQTFGIRAGLNFSTLMGPAEEGVEESFGLNGGFHFGFNYAYNISDVFSIRTELLYMQTGTDYSYKGESYYAIELADRVLYERGEATIDLVVSNAQISIPITAHFELNDKWEVLGGVYTNFLVGPTGTGQLRFESYDRPLEIVFRQSLDYSYFGDEARGTAGDGVVRIIVDDDIISLPRFAGAYYQYFEKDGNAFNVIDLGLTAGVSYFFNRGFYASLRADYGMLDLTNNKMDRSLKEVNTDNSFILRDDKDHHFGLQASFGFRF